MSEPLHVCGWWPETHLASFPWPKSPNHLGSGPQLCSCWILDLASAHIAARGLLSKAGPHHGNQPYCSCHGKHALRRPVLHCYRCRTLEVRKDGWSSNASHFSRSRQATIARAGADSAAAADLRSFVVHNRAAASFLHYFPLLALSHSCLLLLLALDKPSSPMTAGGYPAMHRCVWGGRGRVLGKEKLAQSSGHVLCFCCCLLKEGSCLLPQMQNYAFAYCAADCLRASPTWEQKYWVCNGFKNHWDAW